MEYSRGVITGQTYRLWRRRGRTYLDEGFQGNMNRRIVLQDIKNTHTSSHNLLLVVLGALTRREMEEFRLLHIKGRRELILLVLIQQTKRRSQEEMRDTNHEDPYNESNICEHVREWGRDEKEWIQPWVRGGRWTPNHSSAVYEQSGISSSYHTLLVLQQKQRHSQEGHWQYRLFGRSWNQEGTYQFDECSSHLHWDSQRSSNTTLYCWRPTVFITTERDIQGRWRECRSAGTWSPQLPGPLSWYRSR